MKAKSEIQVVFDDEEIAKNVFRSLQADDDGYITQSVEGCVITARAVADSPGALSQIMDDYLSCMSAARDSLIASKGLLSPSRQRPP
ncbi:MAG TPA: hypothetical protein ENN76_01930 [Euryarchaeota archaeon]|nr:hypothetical protein [Euryarchaeota archaeon]